MLTTIITLLSWIDWLGLTIALGLLCLLIFLIHRRIHPEDNDIVKLPVEPSLSPYRLSTVWRNFIHAIPWRLRSSVVTVPFSILIGEAGSGKTDIIDRYANWQGQDFRFHPSSINDPLLQIYQGVSAVILELSSSLLYDTHPATYRAIKKLWQYLPTNPQAVVVIDASTLLTPDPEYLRLSSHALLGKLQVFNELDGKPLPLVLALTHMEKLEGFVEFCHVLEKSNIPLQIEFPARDGLIHLASCLESFQPYLSRALISCSSQDYLKIVNFFVSAPRLLTVLTEFLQLSNLSISANSSPIVRLCLLSNQVHSFNCDPFALQPSFTLKSPFTLNHHAKTAVILFLTGIIYFSSCYYYQKVLLKEAIEAVKTVRTTPIELYEKNISPLFLDFSADLNKHALLTFQPNFFPIVLEYSNHLLIREIRTYYLIPLLKQAQLEPDAIFKTIQLLTILYGTPNNDMGKLILQKLEDSPTDYMIEFRLLIKEYIENNLHTDELDHALNGFNYTLPEIYERKHQYLDVILQHFDAILEKKVASETELKLISQQSAEFLTFIDEINSNSDGLLMISWLDKNTGLTLNLQHYYNEQVMLRQKSLERLLRLISGLTVLDDNVNCPSTVSIIQCMKKIEALAKEKVDREPIIINFMMDGNQYAYTSNQWNLLIKNQLIVNLLRNTIESHNTRDGWAFFDTPSNYPDLEMNPTNNGKTLFAGKARVDGRLTIDAFEKEVKPAVLGLSSIIAKLPINDNEKKYFNNFVLDNLRVYSNSYVSAYSNYIKQFQIYIDSVWGLNYVLDQIQQPNSPLLQTLVQVKNNTSLKLSDSSNFQPFAQQLAPFNFIQHLMQEKEGVYPEFQKYQAIMAQMQNELNSHEPYLPKKSDGDAAALKGAITPMGRIAWGMLLKEDGNYSTLVKNWLQNAGVPIHLHPSFLAPTQKAAQIGTTEIKQTIDGIWVDIWNSNVTPLLDKFPFLPSAGRDHELSQEELIKIFHPKQGVFWVTVQQYLTPLCKYSNGVWVNRQELTGSLALASSTLDRLNAVQQLTSALWDQQGKPKPLELWIKPKLLPVFDATRLPNAPLVSLAYFRNGGVSVLSFNQQVTWQKLPLEWWTPQAAEVGIEFRKDINPNQAYASINVTDSQWNLFRLLQQSKSAADNHYQWLLAHPDFLQQPLNLEFAFKFTPWAIFTNLTGS